MWIWMGRAPFIQTVLIFFGGKGERGGAGDVTGFYLRCQGELWGSGTLKIVIPVENHPQKPKNRLADYHPLWVVGC